MGRAQNRLDRHHNLIWMTKSEHIKNSVVLCQFIESRTQYVCLARLNGSR
jgi:hypothetical protein